MTFAPVDRCHGQTLPSPPVYRPLLFAYARPVWPDLAGRLAAQWQLERPVSLSLSVLIAMVVIAGLTGLTRTTLPTLVDRFPLAVQLIDPTHSREANAGAAQASVQQAAQAPVPPSPIDASTVTPLSQPEWSVSRIPVLGPAAPGAVAGDGAMQSGRGGSNNGVGSGGTGAYDPYAGAAPRWQRPTHVRSDDIDDHQLQTALAEIKRRFPRARGTVDLRVRLSPGGMVLDVSFMSAIKPGLAQAVRSVLIGRPLAAQTGDVIGGVVSERFLIGVVIG